MIDFIILALPRSGSAWLANLFSSGDVLCLHDPLSEHSLKSLAARKKAHGGILGVVDTSLGLMPGLVDGIDCPKARLMRPVAEINESLAACGLSHRVGYLETLRLQQLECPRIEYEHLHDYTIMSAIFSHLTGREGLDKSRFDELCKLNVQRHPASFAPDYSNLEKLITEYAKHHVT